MTEPASRAPFSAGKAALISLVLLLLAPFSLELSIVLKLFIDTLTVGISNTKTYLFLGYLTVSLALLHNRAEPAPQKRTKNLRTLGYLLAGLHVMVVLEQLYFTQHLGLPPTEILVVYQDYDFAKTSLSHIHVGKAVLGQWLVGANYKFDGGTAFVPFFPRPMLLFHFCFLTATALWALKAMYRDLPSFEKSEQATLILALFVLTETTIDGGPFSSQTLPALVVYLRLVFRCPLPVLGLVTVSILSITAWLTPPLVAENALRALTALAVFMIVNSTFRKSDFPRLLGFCLSLGLISGYLLNVVSPRTQNVGTAYNILRYGLTDIRPNQTIEVVGLQALAHSPAFDHLSENRVGPFVITKLRSRKNTTIFRICREFSLTIARKPVNTNPLPRRFVAKRLILNRQPAEFEQVDELAPSGANINAAAAKFGPDLVIYATLYLQDVARPNKNRKFQ